MAKIGVAYAEITGDLTELSKALIQADEKLKRFGRKKAEGHLGLNKKDFDRAAKEGEAKLARLEKKRAQAILDLDTRGIATADAKIEILKEKLEHLHGEVEIDVDRSNLDRLQGLLFGGAGIGGRGGGGGKGLFTALGGTGGSGRLAQMLGGKSLPILTVAALAAEGALAALTAAVIGLGGALAPLVGGLAVLPGVLAGVSQAGFSLFATFSGIGDAVKAAGEATTKSAVDDTAALQQQRAATEAVRSAKEGLSASQRQAQSAQEALTESRKDAVRTLADMKNQAKDAALAEQGSALVLREAKAELDRVVADPKSSQLDIERAQLGIQQARQGAKEARIEAARAKRDSDRAQAGGVDKMPQVVAARQQLAEANRSVTQSTRALSIAQEQAAERTDKLSASDEKLKEAMDKLSPAGRRFVKFLVDLKPAFRSIRDASQEAALPHFQKGIEGAMKNLPVFRQALTNTSRVLGVTAENFAKFAGSKGFGKDFQIIARANNNVMRNLGRALIPLSKAFNDVAVAAAPFTRWIGRAVLHLARLAAHSAKAGREGGGLARFLRRTRTVMEELGKTIGNLVHGLGGLFGAAFPAGKGFLELMTRITEKFDVWANSTKGQNSIAKFLEDAKGPLKDLGDALVSVLKLIKELMLAPGSGATFQLFSRSVKLLADSLSFLARIPGIGGFLANLALMAVIAGRFGKLGAAITGLRELAAGIRGVAAAEGASSGLRGFGLRIRGMLSTLAKTRVGESIAGNISAGLGVGAIKIRRALDGIKGLITRVLRSAGLRAGEGAAAGAAEGLAASTVPTGKLGGLRGRFGRLGRFLGRGLGAGLAIGLATTLDDEIDKLFGGKSPVQFLEDKLTGGPLDKGSTLTRAEKDAANRERAKVRRRGGIVPGDDAEGDRIRKRWAEEDARDKRRDEREARRTRTKTVEIQTPVLSLKASDVRKSMDRIQAVLRRELGQAKRLIERQVGRWDDVFKGFRLLKGDDPLHLGSGIRKSADNAREALRGIVTSLGRVLERLSNLFGTEGRESARALSRGLAGSDVVSRVARMRADVVSELGKMKRQGSDEARDMVSNLRETFSRLPEVVKRSTSDMLAIVLTAMRALGATGRGRIVAAVDKIDAKAKGGFIKKAQGGFIPGQGLYDSIPLQLPAGSVVENRHQQPVIDFALQMFDRMRYAIGGLVPVLAAPGERVRPPQDVPRVQRALAETQAAGLQPFGSLEQVFGTITRPHYAAKGGEIVQRIVPASCEQPPTLFQDVVQRFAKGGNVRGIVPIPGQPGESIHSSIVKQVVSLMRRYKGRVTDGYAPSGHAAGGEHPKGLAIDVIPGPGGSWDRIDKLAAWAEPSQGSPRAPFRWVGYTGDAGHGRGDHLHLSWGGDGGSIVDTPRIRATTKGPRGAMRDLVSGAVKKVQGAANRRLGRAEGVLSASGPVGKGGALASSTANQKLGRRLMGRVFKSDQWPALRTLWQGESGWKTTADNPNSSAYGIPQALPGSKMRSAGKDWETNPATQIKWGLRYIKDRYGTPSKALSAWRSRSPHWYAKGGFVSPIQAFAKGGFVQALAGGGMVHRLPGGAALTKVLTKYDGLIQEYAAAGQKLESLQAGGTVQTPYGMAPTLAAGSAPSDFGSYVLKGRVLKPGPKFLKNPRSGKKKKDSKPGKGQKGKKTEGIAGVVEDFSLLPYTGTFADEIMPGLLGEVDSLIDPQLEGLLEEYGTAETLAGASTEEYVVTEDKLGKSVAPYIDKTAVQTRLGELDKLISLKSLIAGKIQQIVAAVEYAIQLLVNGVRRRQKAVEAIEAKVRRNQKTIDDLEDKLDKDGGGGINRAIELLAKDGALSEKAEHRVRAVWRRIFDNPIPEHGSGERKGHVAEGKALERFKAVQERYRGRVNELKARNDELAGDDGLKARVIENSTEVWEPNIPTMSEHLTTYRGHGGGWLSMDPFRAGLVDELKELTPRASAEQIAAYKPFTGALGEALWSLERDPHPFPEGSLIAERAELLQQPAGGVLDTLLKKAQATFSPADQAAKDQATFLAAIRDLIKQFGSNIKPIQKFAKGGKVKHSLALVGEEGPELIELPGTKARRESSGGLLSRALGALTAPRLTAESGIRAVAERIKPSLAVVGQGGPEIVELPVGSRVRSHPESKRIAKQMGIEGFARGGVIKPSWEFSPLKIPAFASGGAIAPAEQPQARVEDGQVVIDPRQLKLLIDELAKAKKEVNIDARPEFKEQPTDAHGFSKSLAFELKAAI